MNDQRLAAHAARCAATFLDMPPGDTFSFEAEGLCLKIINVGMTRDAWGWLIGGEDGVRKRADMPIVDSADIALFEGWDALVDSIRGDESPQRAANLLTEAFKSLPGARPKAIVNNQCVNSRLKEHAACWASSSCWHRVRRALTDDHNPFQFIADGLCVELFWVDDDSNLCGWVITGEKSGREHRSFNRAYSIVENAMYDAWVAFVELTTPKDRDRAIRILEEALCALVEKHSGLTGAGRPLPG